MSNPPFFSFNLFDKDLVGSFSSNPAWLLCNSEPTYYMRIEQLTQCPNGILHLLGMTIFNRLWYPSPAGLFKDIENP